MARLQAILERMDELGMVAILGLFYFGQDERLYDEAAVRRAVDTAVSWVLDAGYTKVMVEITGQLSPPLAC
jgi:hypothetical protein